MPPLASVDRGDVGPSVAPIPKGLKFLEGALTDSALGIDARCRAGPTPSALMAEQVVEFSRGWHQGADLGSRNGMLIVPHFAVRHASCCNYG